MSNNVEVRFLEPFDILLFRGNKLFGDPGSFGESLMPPWPSQVAGALRSRLLIEDGIDLNAFARGQQPHRSLGSPQSPGPFTLLLCSVARRFADGRLELVAPPPADALIADAKDGSGPEVRLMHPRRFSNLPSGWGCSYPLSSLPVLAQPRQSKPADGWWLTESGWTKYLQGQRPEGADRDLVKVCSLWGTETRVGVGLSRQARAAEEGRLFSNRVVALRKSEHARRDETPHDVGFLVAYTGAKPESLPAGALLRLGGDNRAGVVHAAPGYRIPQADYEKICAAGRCRLVLASPGIFEDGWMPTGSRRESDSIAFELHGVEGRLVAAAVPRSQVISGWDLARWLPKGARRAAPAGSVYWLEDLKATPADLERLARYGLWSEPDAPDPRRAEGFNRLWLAEWPAE